MSGAGRLLSAAVQFRCALRDDAAGLLREFGKVPMQRGARQRLQSLPRMELPMLLSRSEFTVRCQGSNARHAWSLGAAEQLILQMLIEDRGVQTAFEIGTFNGGTTAAIAEALPPDGQIITVDLPDEAFSRTQAPADFSASQVGEVHRASEASDKVTQLRTDSLHLDSAHWRDWADLVLVDGAHDYEHGFADSRSAVEIVKPGGVIIWDDFEPYWHGLVNGVLDGLSPRQPSCLVGSPLGILPV